MSSVCWGEDHTGQACQCNNEVKGTVIMTATAVPDGKLTNEQLGRFHRRTGEILRRINEGTLDFEYVLNELQMVTEGRTVFEPRQWMVWTSIELVDVVRTRYDLVLVSTTDLGFVEDTSLENIYHRARSLGLQLCPRNTIFAVLTKHKDDREIENINVGMEPVLPQPGGGNDTQIYWFRRRGSREDVVVETTPAPKFGGNARTFSPLQFWLFVKPQK
jgi:hypothetical protein